MMEKLLGIDRRRVLPAWKRQTFERWLAANPPRSSAAGTRVTLFNDTFLNHYDPEIGIAALAILEKGGCQVSVVRPGCCGRPLISQGLLAEARAQAAQVVEALFPIAERGEKILFCGAELSVRPQRRRTGALAGRTAEEGADGSQGLHAVR